MVLRLWPAERVIMGSLVSKHFRRLLQREAETVVLKIAVGLRKQAKDQQMSVESVLATIAQYNCERRVRLELDCAGCREHVETLLKVVESLSPRYQVVKLEMGGCRVQDKAPRFFDVLRGCQNLTHLNLGCTRLQGVAVGALTAALGEDCALRHLRLRWNRIAEGTQHLMAELPKKCKQLEHLDLRGNDIGDEGATYVAEALGKLTALTHLDLRMNWVGSEGLDALAWALAEMRHTLTHLDLGENFARSEDQAVLLEAIALHPSLRSLDLTGPSPPVPPPLLLGAG